MSEFQKLYSRKAGKCFVDAVDGPYGQSISISSGKKKPDGTFDNVRIYIGAEYVKEFIEAIQEAAMYIMTTKGENA